MDEFLKVDEVLKLTGFSIHIIYGKNIRPPFPKKYKDGFHVKWLRSEVEEWMCLKKEEKSTHR